MGVSLEFTATRQALAGSFGLVRPAPPFLVWAGDDVRGWGAVAGADTAAEARRLAAALGGRVLRRGHRPDGRGVNPRGAP